MNKTSSLIYIYVTVIFSSAGMIARTLTQKINSLHSVFKDFTQGPVHLLAVDSRSICNAMELSSDYFALIVLIHVIFLDSRVLFLSLFLEERVTRLLSLLPYFFGLRSEIKF